MTAIKLFQGSRFLGALPLAALLLGAPACTGSSGSGPAPDQERSRTVAGQQDHTAGATVTSQRALPPLRLALSGTELEGSLTEVTVTLTHAGQLPAPARLRVRLPEGANLIQGQAEELLPALRQQPDQVVTRVYRISGRGAGVIQVTAEVTARGYGAHAVARYPAPAPDSADAPVQSRRMAPTRVKGVVLQESVPIRAD